MIVVQNRIRVNAGFEDRFEQRNEDTSDEAVPGRLFFAQLKTDEQGVYINMSAWTDRDAFDAWLESDNFKRAHSGGVEGMVAGRPEVTIAEVLYSEGSLAPGSA